MPSHLLFQVQPCFGNGACDQCNRQKPCDCQLGYLAPYCQAGYDQLVQCFQGKEFQCVTCYAESALPETVCQNCHNYTLVLDGQTEDYEIPCESLPHCSCQIGIRIRCLCFCGSPSVTQQGSTLGCSFTDGNLCTYTYYIGVWINSTQTNHVLLVSVEPLGEATSSLFLVKRDLLPLNVHPLQRMFNMLLLITSAVKFARPEIVLCSFQVLNWCHNGC